MTTSSPQAIFIILCITASSLRELCFIPADLLSRCLRTFLDPPPLSPHLSLPAGRLSSPLIRLPPLPEGPACKSSDVIRWKFHLSWSIASQIAPHKSPLEVSHIQGLYSAERIDQIWHKKSLRLSMENTNIFIVAKVEDNDCPIYCNCFCPSWMISCAIFLLDPGKSLGFCYGFPFLCSFYGMSQNCRYHCQYVVSFYLYSFPKMMTSTPVTVDDLWKDLSLQLSVLFRFINKAPWRIISIIP